MRVAAESATSSPDGYGSWLPRLTGGVMGDLRIWMLAFGLLIGAVFPFAVALLGVPTQNALRPGFFAATITAGLLVAEVNHALARGVVGVRLRSLAAALRRVEGTLTEATFSGAWSTCNPQSCKVVVDSTDELGTVATSFNNLVEGLATSHRVAGDVAAVSEAMAEHLELGDLAAATLQELADRVGCAASALLTVSNGRIQLAGSVGIVDPTGLPDSEAVTRTLRLGKPVTFALPAEIVVTSAIVDVRPRHVSLLPLSAGVLTVGVLLVAWLEEPSAEATGVVGATIPGLGVALHNALNHMDLQQVAALDPLTEVYNRRFGLRRLCEEFSRSARSGDPLGVLMMDLDNFKVINDTYGHLAGDRLLQAVTCSTRSVLRDGDVIIRYGGEEFLLVLPGAGGADISLTAERIRRAVADTVITDAGQRIGVTVSVGGAGLPHPLSETPNDLIGLADNALYAAKSSGRDRCVIA